MASARCPVCEDIITIGISIKLYQSVICPTCLTSLKVVSVTPLELEVPEVSANSGYRRSSHPNHKRNVKSNKPRRISEQYGDDDYEYLDDYMLERSLRSKSERENRRKSSKGD